MDAVECELCGDETEMLVSHEGLILCWACIEAVDEMGIPLTPEQIKQTLAYVRQRNQ